MEFDFNEDIDCPFWLMENFSLEEWLDNKMFVEWFGKCPFCKYPKCLLGWIPILENKQIGLKLQEGDGVCVKHNEQEITGDGDLKLSNNAIYIVTRVRSKYLLGKPILAGGTFYNKNFGDEIELQRSDVILSAKYALHPVPQCEKFTTLDVDKISDEIQKILTIH